MIRGKKISVSKENHRKVRPWVVRWWGEYNVLTGKQKRYGKAFERRTDAQIFINAKIEEWERGAARDQRDITLGELCDKFIESKKNELRRTSLNGYKNTVDKLTETFSKQANIKHIREEDARRFALSLKTIGPGHVGAGKKLSDCSRNRYVREARKIFGTAVAWNYIKENPFTAIKERKPRREPWYYISPAEFHKILVQTKNLRIKAFYLLCYYCGLRAGEAINLLWDKTNVDLTRGQVTIVNRRGSHDIPPFYIKDYESRSVPMPAVVRDILLTLKEQKEDNCPFILVNQRRYESAKTKWQKLVNEGREDEWINANLLNDCLREFKKHCKDAGINTTKKLNLHCLRKGYGTNLANRNVPAITVKKLLGHSNIQTTMQYYLQSTDENEKKAVEILDSLAFPDKGSSNENK